MADFVALYIGLRTGTCKHQSSSTSLHQTGTQDCREHYPQHEVVVSESGERKYYQTIHKPTKRGRTVLGELLQLLPLSDSTSQPLVQLIYHGVQY